MPDGFGFNDMGAVRSCIWCNYKVGAWVPETVLANHHKKHQKDRERAAEESAREKSIADRLD